jgi:hypothetical protein
MSALEQVRERLDQHGCGPRGHNGKIEARCPAHSDRRASLSVGEGREGRVVLKCHAGCEPEQVLDALGLTWTDLFADDGAAGNAHREIETTYDYTDEQGSLLYQVVRFNPKGFAQRRPDGTGGWTWKLGDTRRVLYKLPVVIAAVERGDPIAIVEGEKDQEALERLGKVATCNAGGAGKWRAEYAKVLKGAKVAVIADRDEPGRWHAREVAASLDGIAASVKVLEPPAAKDVAEHLAKGGKLAELVELPAAGLQPVSESIRPPAVDDESSRRITLTTAASVKPEVVQWAWEGRIPLGALSLIVGHPGLGKSTATALIAAQLSCGELEGSLQGEPCNVLMVSFEDHLAAVVRPRLEAAGADLERVRFVGVEQDGQHGLLNLPGDLDMIEAAAEALQPRLLVVDPLVAALSKKTDAHRDHDVRLALAPLASYAERAHVAVCGVMHLNKQEAQSMLSRVSGSIGFGGAPRAVLGFLRDPDDADGEVGYERLLLPVKCSWGQYPRTLKCRIESAAVETDDGPSHQSLLKIIGESDITHADLAGNVEPGEGEEADEFVEEQLGDAI